MKDGQQLFFGVPVVSSTPDTLTDEWGAAGEVFRALVFVDRVLLWRIVRSKDLRRFLQDHHGCVVPTARGSSRQLRVATGAAAPAYPELPTVVRILAAAERDTASIYLAARNQTQLQRIEQNVRATFPKLRIVGRAVVHSANAASISTAIRKAAPRIVFVGSDAAAMLKWIRAYAPKFGPTTVLIASRAAQRMTGGNETPRSGWIPAVAARPFMGPILLAHRLVVRRRRKKRQV
jgi:N-acetylglucosaminyldiphosphoundecaprenol N-acetyl-beta-D-mannosaminyltransferase